MRDGTLSFVVGSSQLNFSLARMDEQGELTLDCVNGVEQAADLLETLPADVSQLKATGMGVEE